MLKYIFTLMLLLPQIHGNTVEIAGGSRKVEFNYKLSSTRIGQIPLQANLDWHESDPVELIWTVTGHQDATFTTIRGAKTVLKVTAGGLYKVRLIATDGRQAQSSTIELQVIDK